jgi:hypothetical protein
MRFDNRTADGESHAHPVLLRREERLEDALVLDTGSGIANFDADRTEAITVIASTTRLARALSRASPRGSRSLVICSPRWADGVAAGD